jgi:hypothetical protein
MMNVLTAEEVKHRILIHATSTSSKSTNSTSISPKFTPANSHPEILSIDQGKQLELDLKQYNLNLTLSGIVSTSTMQFPLDDTAFLQQTQSFSHITFIQQAYSTYLRRSLDSEGQSYYLQRLEAGTPRHEILLALRHSDEFKAKELEYLQCFAEITLDGYVSNV